MTSRLTLATAAVAALLLLPAPSGSAAARDRCAATGTFEEVVLTDTRVRVLRDDLEHLVCDRRSGRRTELYTEDGKYGSVEIEAVRGRFVAASYEEVAGCPIPGCGEPPVVQAASTAVVDAARGTRRELSGGAVVPLRLRSDGVVVWLDGFGDARRLLVWDRRGRRVLDPGPVALSSVRLRGAAVRWTDAAGTARSARVTAPR